MNHQELKKLIETTYNQEVRYPKDCDALAGDISAKTGNTISPSTLKRLLGLAKTESKPTQYTLDTIAKYLGHRSWSEFLAHYDNSKRTPPEQYISKTIEQTVHPQSTKRPKRRKKIISFGITVVIGIVGILIFTFLIGLNLDVKPKYSISNLPEARNAGRAFVVGKSIFYFGGSDALNVRDNTWIFESTKKIWSELSPMPTARAEFAAALLNNKIYCFGGWLGNSLGATDLLEIYDVKTNKWSIGAPLPFSLTSASAVTYQNDIYILGGTTGNTKTIFLKYNTTTDSYCRLPIFDQQRLYSSLVIYKSQIFAFGGNSFSKGEYQWHNDVDIFEISQAKWHSVSSIPYSLTRSWGTLQNDEIHLVGGTDGFGNDNPSIKDLHLIYNISSDKWREEKNVPYPISAHQLIYYEDELLIIGGTSKFPNPLKTIVAL